MEQSNVVHVWRKEWKVNRDVRRRVDAARFGILLDGRWNLALQEWLQLLLGVQEAEVAVASRCPLWRPS